MNYNEKYIKTSNFSHKEHITYSCRVQWHQLSLVSELEDENKPIPPWRTLDLMSYPKKNKAYTGGEIFLAIFKFPPTTNLSNVPRMFPNKKVNIFFQNY